MTNSVPPVCITVLAHQEAARIAICMRSLPLGDARAAIHIVVNGSTDQTAIIARDIASGFANVTVHEFAEGGKARSWNRFMFDTLGAFHPVHVFVDGDAEVAAGSIGALASILESNPHANAASALPLNGRKALSYQDAMRQEHGLFGDLYALRQLVMAILPGLGAALIMSVAVWTVDHLVMAYIWRDIPAPLHLAALTISGALTYGALLYFGARATFDEVIGLVVRRKPAEAKTEASA